jgi:hypothetical protein
MAHQILVEISSDSSDYVWEPEFSFFYSRPQNSTKTGSLKFGNK